MTDIQTDTHLCSEDQALAESEPYLARRHCWQWACRSDACADADQEGVRAPCVSRLAADGDRGRQVDGEELQKLRRLCSDRAPGTSVNQQG